MFNPKSILPLALSSTLIPTVALADVTPMDVWTLHQNMYKAIGGVLEAEVTEAGGTLTIAEATWRFALPMFLGDITMTSDGWSYVDNGDGTVTARFPDTMNLTAGLSIPRQVIGSIKMQVNSDGYEMVASGTPNDMTLRYDFPTQEIIISDFKATGLGLSESEFAGLQETDISGSFKVTGNSGTIRVTQGDLLAIEGDFVSETGVFEISVDGANGLNTTISGGTGETDMGAKLSLLPDGVSVMAIPQALRDGFGVTLESSARDGSTTNLITQNGAPFSNRKESYSSYDFGVSLDQDGFRFDGIGTEYKIVTDELKAMFPLPIEVTVKRGEFALQMPVMEADAAQEFALLTDVSGLNVADNLWSMLDPAAILPRDAADIVIDVTGNVATLYDLFDVEAVTNAALTETSPFVLEDMTISSLVMSIAGAKLTGTGAFSFDNADMETFAGFPAPTGMLDLALTGGTGLLDKLVAMNMLPEQSAMGARMMSGVFAKPGDGEDSLVTKIEIDGATGAVSANGQRLQ